MGYSEAKFTFRIEMSDYIMVLGIFLSSGDTSKYAHRYKIRDSVSLVPYKSFDRSWLQIRHNQQTSNKSDKSDSLVLIHSYIIK